MYCCYLIARHSTLVEAGSRLARLPGLFLLDHSACVTLVTHESRLDPAVGRQLPASSGDLALALDHKRQEIEAYAPAPRSKIRG